MSKQLFNGLAENIQDVLTRAGKCLEVETASNGNAVSISLENGASYHVAYYPAMGNTQVTVNSAPNTLEMVLEGSKVSQLPSMMSAMFGLGWRALD